MIARMSKYNFVLYSGECESLVAKLREVGLVDITTTGWEPSERDMSLLLEIEGYAKAETLLDNFKESESFDKAALPFSSGSEAYEHYSAAQAAAVQHNSDIARLEKDVDELRPWGEFSAETMQALLAQGLVFRYFTCAESVFDANVEQWSASYTLELIAREESRAYFVLVERCDAPSEVDMDAQEVKAPQHSAACVEAEIEALRRELAALNPELSRCAQSIELLAQYRTSLISQLEELKVKSSAQSAADGALLVMEGWAEESTSAKVDALLEAHPNVIYLKSRPTPEDNTPVKLENRPFARIFEMIGNMYALPKYGTMDLTPLFAPFYMLFFAICLCDAGYGAVILAAGLGLMFKGGKDMRQAAWLSTLCGAAAVVFGFLANSFFGMTISSAPAFSGFKFIDFQNDFFTISMMIGVFQILLGMAVNIYVSSRCFGFKYALGTLGWFLLIFSASASAALSAMGVAGFGFSSIPFYVMVGISLVLMLFFNSPDKNIFANFGAGIWNTYNNITGLLSDVLSYVRLFAIGLSGGVLALVFNSLALGMTGLDGDVSGEPIFSIILKVLGATIILLIGHGINLFMSAISSFVHPMRLTFVEFFKNAGFEATTRKFNPLK